MSEAVRPLADVPLDLAPAEARELTDRIKVVIGGAWELVKQAYEGRAWVALGHPSWDAYCSAEFGASRLRLPREERQEVVASLRDSGLSIRGIAAATGQSYGTVRADLAAGEQKCSPAADLTSRPPRLPLPLRSPSRGGRSPTASPTPPPPTRRRPPRSPVHDKVNANLLAATARLIVAYRNGSIRHADSQGLGEITNSEVLALVEGDPFVSWSVTIASTFKGIPANPAAIAFSAYVMGRVDSESARAFLSAVAEMRTRGIGDPANTLLRRLQVARDQRERLTSVQQAYLVLRAWSAWRDGLVLKQLKMSSTSGPMPFPAFPVGGAK